MPFLAQGCLRAIWQRNRIPIQLDGNLCHGHFPTGIPIIGEFDAQAFDGMGHDAFPVREIGFPMVGTVALAVGIGAVGAQAIAVSVGDLADPQTPARSLPVPLLGFLAEVVDIDLREHAQDGQHQLAPGGGEIQLLLHRGQRDPHAVELVQRGQQAAQVAVEAVDLIHHDHIEQAFAGIPQQLLKSRAVAALFGRDAGVGIQLDQVPALRLDKILNMGGLGIQAVSFGLLLG